MTKLTELKATLDAARDAHNEAVRDTEISETRITLDAAYYAYHDARNERDRVTRNEYDNAVRSGFSIRTF